jgi:UDP:flavonoid glycosyltransferase YjiC (YdhE family)
MATGCAINLPEHGHLNATLPLARELVSRGDRIIYFGTEPYRRAIEVTGAEYARYAGDATLFDPPAHTGGLYSVMAFLMGIAEHILPYVLRRLELERPDYLLIDSMCVWGRLAQQITGIPAVTLGSVFVPDDRRVTMEEMILQAYSRAPREVLLAGIDALNTYLRTSQRVDRHHGTSSPNIVEFFANRQPLNVLFTSRYFHLSGEDYDDSYLFVGPSLAPRSDESIANLNLLTTGAGTAAAAFAPASAAGDASAPLIYMSLGTIFNDRPDFYRACFAALADGPWQVIASVGRQVNRDDLGPIPANVTVRDYVWQLDVLPRASLCITHGGMNTTNEALWFGLPLLVCPQHGDQHLVAARVAELGAGLHLTPPDIQPARLRELVTRVLSDPAFKREADKIAASFRAAGGVVRAADAIMAYVATTLGPTSDFIRARNAVRTAGASGMGEMHAS